MGRQLNYRDDQPLNVCRIHLILFDFSIFVAFTECNSAIVDTKSARGATPNFDSAPWQTSTATKNQITLNLFLFLIIARKEFGDDQRRRKQWKCSKEIS